MKRGSRRNKGYSYDKKPFRKKYDDASILGLTLILLAILCFSLTGIYGYVTFFAVASSGDYEATISSGTSVGVATSEEGSYVTDISIGEPIVGSRESESYKLEIGSKSYLGADFEAPLIEKWQSTSTPSEGEKVILSAKCIDDSPPITVIFWDSINGEGDPKSLNSEQTSEVVFDTTGLEGVVKWKVSAADIFDNSFSTKEVEFTINAVDRSPPVISEVKQSTNNPVEGEIIVLSVKATDDFGLKEVVFEVNGIKQVPKRVSGKEDIIEFEFDTSDFPPGTEIKWKVYVKDGAEFEIISDEKSFIVQAGAAGENCEDELTNQDETDVDCGGKCLGCVNGKKCLEDKDCRSVNCVDDVCTEPTETCESLQGNICEVGQTCEGGKFKGSSDSEGLCCLFGTCTSAGEKCEDGTPYYECSKEDIGKYCEEGLLIDNCLICSCAEGFACGSDGVCEPATGIVYWIGGGLIAAAGAGIGGVLLFKKKKGKGKK